jgi:hypothetical protein
MTNCSCLPSNTEWFCRRPDIQSVCSLLVRAWNRPCREYTPDLLKSHYCRYAEDFSEVGLYVGDILGGYICHVPMDIRYAGRKHRVAIGRFWCGNPDMHSHNIGYKLQREIVHQSKQKGFEGLLSISEVQSKAAKSFELSTRRMGLEPRLLMEFKILMGLSRRIRRCLGRGEAVNVAYYQPDYRSACHNLFLKLHERCDLARIVPENEIDFLLSSRPFCKTWLYLRDGCVCGLLNGLRIPVLGIDRKSIDFYVENIYLQGLTAEEIRAFLRTVFQDLFWDDIESIFIASTGYFNDREFLDSGFLYSNTKCNLYYVPYTDQTADLNLIQSCYLDVF